MEAHRPAPAFILSLTLNPSVDQSTAVEHVSPDRKLRCRQPAFAPGGGGINAARVAKRLGGTPSAWYTAGGAEGQHLGELLAAEQVDAVALPVGGRTRQSLAVYEETSGRQYRFGLPGPELAAEEWQGCLDRLTQADPRPDYLVASGSLPPGVPVDFYARACRLGRELGCRVVVDTSGPALRALAGAGAYLLKPNARELADLAGEPFEDEEQQEELARRAVEAGTCEVLVLSLGAAGVLLVHADTVERIPSPSVRIRSTVGAGDSMLGAIVLGLARGWSTGDAVRYGVAAGAAAVTTSGSELCRIADVERLWQGMQRRRSALDGQCGEGSSR